MALDTTLNHVVATKIEELRIQGFTLLPEVLSAEILVETRARMDQLVEKDIEKFGAENLRAIGELGTLRFLIANDRFFLNLIALPQILEIVETLLDPACILHLQNGIILLPEEKHQQGAFHQDYRRWMNGYDVSFNAFFLVDEFTIENGGTIVVPGTHLLPTRPSDDYLEKNAVQIVGKAGSVLLFNSRLWHRGGKNTTSARRRAINTQYTYSYIRSQIDLAHCLPEEEYQTLPERIQQLMGRFVRSPKSIEEFRLPADKRFYKAGQG